jgi:hypothetical protein
MFFIPLNQVESVELVVHALRMAGGEADCSSCPARRVCMKQCLSIAASVEKMVAEETLPTLDLDADTVAETLTELDAEEAPPAPESPGKQPDRTSRLKVIK